MDTPDAPKSTVEFMLKPRNFSVLTLNQDDICGAVVASFLKGYYDVEIH